jgi:hypothetical protein
MSDQLKDDEADWAASTWEENRLLQHREFRALSFREKVAALEEMERVIRALQSNRKSGTPRQD